MTVISPTRRPTATVSVLDNEKSTLDSQPLACFAIVYTDTDSLFSVLMINRLSKRCAVFLQSMRLHRTVEVHSTFYSV